MAKGAIADERLLSAAARAKAHLINSFAAEFYARRLELGLREEDVATAIGSSQSRVSAFERAEGNPTLDTIARLAAVLGVEVEIEVRPAAVREGAAEVAVQRAARPRQRRPVAGSIHPVVPMAAKAR